MQQPPSHSSQHCLLRGQDEARALGAGVNAPPACSSTMLAPPHPQTHAQNRPRVHEPLPRRHPGPHGDAASTMQHHSIGPPLSFLGPEYPIGRAFVFSARKRAAVPFDLLGARRHTSTTMYMHRHVLLLRLHPILRLLLLRFKHNLLHLHLVKQVVALHRLAQRHNLVRHEPVCVSRPAMLPTIKRFTLTRAYLDVS